MSLPAPSFPELSPQGVKPLMTHFFLQLLVNPETGVDGSSLALDGQSAFTVVTHDPRLARVKLRNFKDPIYNCAAISGANRTL